MTSLAAATHFIRETAQPRLPVLAGRFRQWPVVVHLLKNLPVDFLKIDGQFMHNVGTTTSTAAWSRRSRRSARAMGIRTVAERVDSRKCSPDWPTSHPVRPGHYIGAPAVAILQSLLTDDSSQVRCSLTLRLPLCGAPARLRSCSLSARLRSRSTTA